MSKGDINATFRSSEICIREIASNISQVVINTTNIEYLLTKAASGMPCYYDGQNPRQVGWKLDLRWQH